ncbi:MAG: TolC family protein [Chitinispirillaceae bacterium]|nr:TolC family protein [Chitinispirillaceae bacterium]
MKRRIITTTKNIAVLLFLLPSIAATDTLSLHGYVTMALEHNPQPKMAASAVQSSEAAREKSRASLLPRIGASAGISRSGRSSSSGGPGTTIYSTGTGNSSSAGIDAQALLFDFGKTSLQYKASGKNLDAVNYDLKNTHQTTVLNARSAYFNFLLSEQLLKVNEDAYKQAQLHYHQAKTLFEVGKQAQIAVTKANVDVANALVNVIHARNSLKLARVQLETTAGTTITDPLVLTDSLGETEDSITMNDALTRAAQKRPELLASKARLEAARLQLKAARATYFPAINASGGYNWRNSSTSAFPSPLWYNPGWSIGAALSIPLFQGGSLHAGVRQADAAYKQAMASLDAVTLNVTQEVQQNVLQEIEARERISATAVLVAQAAESLRMSQERYRTGIATSIEITDAEVTLADARSSHVQAQFDYRIAHAKLLAAIGALNE